MTPFVVANLIWQWISLPSLAPQKANPMGQLVGLLKRRNVGFAMLGVMLTFAGAFTTFTYLRPFLETYTHVTVPQLSLLLLGLGLAGFVGTYFAGALLARRLYSLSWALPLALAFVTLGLMAVGQVIAHADWATARRPDAPQCECSSSRSDYDPHPALQGLKTYRSMPTSSTTARMCS